MLVVIKRSKQVFKLHKETFYRDKNSVRNNLTNQEQKPPEHLKQYWQRRYYIFSKFDKGVKIDEESWYSVTPEPLAKHIAARVNQTHDLESSDDPALLAVLDGFSGVGGNMI